MKTIVRSTAIASIFFSIFALAHGEDKAGPNGGFIRMPGAFHTELIPQGKNQLKVYLLDIQWKNPSIKKSSLKISYNDKLDAKCIAENNYFLCSFPKSVDLTKNGHLKVAASRENQNGNEVSYTLPLKLEVIDDGHGGHH